MNHITRSFYKNLLLIISLASAFAASGKAIDDAKALYQQGQYQEAIAKLDAILKASPRDGTANYYKGMSQLALNDKASASTYLEKAEDRGIADAAWQLTLLAYDSYLMDEAAEHLDTYEKLLKKNRKSLPEAAEELRSHMVMAKNMLQRVEKLQIIDSLVVDSVAFFKHYQLSDGAGALINGNMLPPQFAAHNPRIAFKPQGAKEIFWGMEAEDGSVQLYSASILDDGTMETASALGEQLGEGGDADFPFFASDGMTFYFANNGENSLGGYDIFMSRRDTDGTVFEPQNIGMPYNSPYDDYMLAIDEDTGIGWWATDRNQIPGKVTIYVFVVNDTRINYDANDENLAQHAFIRDISATQTPETPTMEQVLEKVAQSHAEQYEDDDHFMLSLGNGKIYRQLDDFRNPQARQAMEQYLERLKDTRLMEARLATLRKSWAQGDHGVRNDILSLEKRISAAESMLKKLRNQAISLEK